MLIDAVPLRPRRVLVTHERDDERGDDDTERGDDDTHL